MNNPSTRITISPEERELLHARARAVGLPLSEVFRRGARMYLDLGDGPEYRRGRPSKRETATA